MKPRHAVRRLAVVGAVMFALLTTSAATIAEQAKNVDDAPIPVAFPRDDGPHDVPIEWWYYTGHLFTVNGQRYGFEFVVFKRQQGQLTAYASHFAITDNTAGTFRYDQYLGLAPAGANDGGVTGFDLTAGDWQMRGLGGTDLLYATTPGYAVDLSLVSERAPVLHDGDGFIDYGNGDGSYYYSRTRIDVVGAISIDGIEEPVTGEAWFDHQWGEFTTFLNRGWDWYSIQLEDRTELMLYVLRGSDGGPSIIDGSFVGPDGALTLLEGADFSVIPTGAWTSPATGIEYPAGWTVSVRVLDLTLTLKPSIAGQELNTTASTSVIYWEGEVTITGIRNGAAVTGLGYVELTGYAPVLPAEATPLAFKGGTPQPQY